MSAGDFRPVGARHLTADLGARVYTASSFYLGFRLERKNRV